MITNTSDQDAEIKLNDQMSSITVLAGSSITVPKTDIADGATYDVTFAGAVTSGSVSINFFK